MRISSRLQIAGLVLLVFQAACSGPRATFRDGVVTRDAVRYGVGDPGPGWVIQKSGEYGDLMLRNEETGAYLSANSTCNRYEDSPLRRLAENLLWGLTEQNRLRESVIPFAGREAFEMELTGKLDGVPIQLYVLVLKKDRCIFDFSCAARPDRFDPVRESCEKFVKGFEDLR